MMHNPCYKCPYNRAVKKKKRVTMVNGYGMVMILLGENKSPIGYLSLNHRRRNKYGFIYG